MAQSTIARLEVPFLPAQPQLSLCCWDDPETDFSCQQPAVIHDVATELDYCARHYRAVRRG